MNERLNLPDFLDLLRAWLVSEVNVFLDGQFPYGSCCMVGRLTAVESDRVTLLSADTLAEFGFDPRAAADRFERGTVVTVSGKRFELGIQATLPDGSTLIFHLAELPTDERDA